MDGITEGNDHLILIMDKEMEFVMVSCTHRAQHSVEQPEIRGIYHKLEILLDL